MYFVAAMTAISTPWPSASNNNGVAHVLSRMTEMLLAWAASAIAGRIYGELYRREALAAEP